MIEFLNYVPPEGSIGEMLLESLPIIAGVLIVWLMIRIVWLMIREIRKSLDD